MQVTVDLEKSEIDLLKEMLAKIIEDGHDYLTSIDDHESTCSLAREDFDPDEDECTCEQYQWLVEEQKALDKLFQGMP